MQESKIIQQLKMDCPQVEKKRQNRKLEAGMMEDIHSLNHQKGKIP